MYLNALGLLRYLIIRLIVSLSFDHICAYDYAYTLRSPLLTNILAADIQSGIPTLSTRYIYLRNWDARILTSAPFIIVTNAGTINDSKSRRIYAVA